MFMRVSEEVTIYVYVEITAWLSLLGATVTSVSSDLQMLNNLFFSVLTTNPVLFYSDRDNPFKFMVLVVPKNQKSQLLGDAAPLGITEP